MPDTPTAARTTFGDIAPAHTINTDAMPFAVWERPPLSKCDRNLITVPSLEVM